MEGRERGAGRGEWVGENRWWRGAEWGRGRREEEEEMRERMVLFYYFTINMSKLHLWIGNKVRVHPTQSDTNHL